MSQVTMTLNQIRAHGPCKPGWEILLKALGKTAPDDEPIPLAFIVESNGIRDAIWCMRVNWFEHKPLYMEFVNGCVKRARKHAADADAAAYAADADAAAYAAEAAYADYAAEAAEAAYAAADAAAVAVAVAADAAAADAAAYADVAAAVAAYDAAVAADAADAADRREQKRHLLELLSEVENGR